MKGTAGGKAVVQKYGVDYMRSIGRKGAIAFWTKYKLVPVYTRRFAIVNRETGKIIGYRD